MLDKDIYESLCVSTLSKDSLRFIEREYHNYEDFLKDASCNFPRLHTGAPRDARIRGEISAFADFLIDYISEHADNEDEEFYDGPMREEEFDDVDELIESRIDYFHTYRDVRKNVLQERQNAVKIKKEKEQNIIVQISKLISAFLYKFDSPIELSKIIDEVHFHYPEVYNLDKIVSKILQDTSLFKVVSTKMLYTNVGRNVFTGSIEKCIMHVLEKYEKPILSKEICDEVLNIRPDTNAKSVKAVLASMLTQGKLLYYEENRIGLINNQSRDSSRYTQVEYDGKKSFEEHLKELNDFVAKNNRMPLSVGPFDEQSIASWYAKQKREPSLPTNQMVALFQFQKNIEELRIPQNADEVSFKINCDELKSYLMKFGNLPSRIENKKLHDWFGKICRSYSHLDGNRKAYFDDLVNVIEAFGYELRLSQ